MGDTTILIDKLIQEIKKDITLSNELLEILIQEKVCLEQKNIEQMEAIIEQKNRIVLALNDNQTARDTIQEQLGGPIGFKGLQYILKKFNLQKHPVFKVTLQELEKLLLQIQKLSSINSSIIAVSQTQTTRIIDVLRGRKNTCYGEDAHIYSTNTSNFLTKA
jgi:flagellar biosynthesis/type III secretory pathway chaperone